MLQVKNNSSMDFTQHFPCKTVCTEMWLSDHVLRKHMKLEVHENAYKIDG